jgi:hypothetical protein
MDLLIVERSANWSQWSHVTRSLRQPVRMLFQQSGESIDELFARAEAKLARPDSRPVRRVVVLGAEGLSELVGADA